MSNQTTVETKVALLHYAGADQFVAQSPSGHAIVTSFSSEKLTAPSPMELLLIALGGCTGADVVAILEKKRQHLTSYDIEVRAQRRAEYPRIYTHIEVIHRVCGRNVDEKAVADAIRLSETKYCSVSAMLGLAVPIETRFEICAEPV
jgi:putative redox protein